jgi:hypothetical protein
MSMDEKVFGTGLTTEEYDFLMHTFIDKKYHQFEVELFKAKWFDYRFIHPVEATYVFFQHYKTAYRNAFARNVDRERAEFVRIGKYEDLFDLKNLSNSERTSDGLEQEKRAEIRKQKTFVTGIWRARQHADAMGLPYEFSIEACIRHTLRYWKQPHLPRPEQISSERVCQAVMTEWFEKKQNSVIYSNNPAFKNDAFQGFESQIEHRRHLLDLAGYRSNPNPLLQRFVDENMITEFDIAGRFDALTLNRVFQSD